MSHSLAICRRPWNFVLWLLCLYVFLPWAPPGRAASVDTPAGIIITQGKTKQGFAYLSGGIGTDERAMMEASSNAYNVKLSFAEKSGPYLSDVKLIIETAEGAEIVNATTNGPWFYIQLPAGAYTVRATLSGVTKEIKNLTVLKDKTIQRTLIWDLGEPSSRR